MRQAVLTSRLCIGAFFDWLMYMINSLILIK